MERNIHIPIQISTSFSHRIWNATKYGIRSNFQSISAPSTGIKLTQRCQFKSHQFHPNVPSSFSTSSSLLCVFLCECLFGMEMNSNYLKTLNIEHVQHASHSFENGQTLECSGCSDIDSIGTVSVSKRKM